MTKTLQISKDAEFEILDAYLWYESKSKGLGKRFKAELNSRYQQIKKTPNLYPIVKTALQLLIRKCVLKVFPSIVFYFYSETSINVIAIFHSSRKPEY